MTAWMLVACVLTCAPVDPEHLTRAQCERYARPMISAGVNARCIKVERTDK